MGSVDSDVGLAHIVAKKACSDVRDGKEPLTPVEIGRCGPRVYVVNQYSGYVRVYIIPGVDY